MPENAPEVAQRWFSIRTGVDGSMFLFQYKLTVPKVGYISDLCTSLSNLSGVPAEKVYGGGGASVSFSCHLFVNEPTGNYFPAVFPPDDCNRHLQPPFPPDLCHQREPQQHHGER